MVDGYEGDSVRDAWDSYDCLTTSKHQFDLSRVNRWPERVERLQRVEARPLLKAAEAKLIGAGPPPEEFLRCADGVRWIHRGGVL